MADAPLGRQDNLDPTLFGQTPAQTVGPFFHFALPWKGGADLVGSSDLGARPDLVPGEHYLLATSQVHDAPRGEVIEIAGRVCDAEGATIADAMVEIWQANAAGLYASVDDARADIAIDPNFIGFARCATDDGGIFRFRTIRPGRVPGPGNSLQAPHLALSVFARGVIKRLATRLYFAGEEGNETDSVLAIVPEGRRETLIAKQREDGAWWLDIFLGGANETVFFDL